LTLSNYYGTTYIYDTNRK